MNSPYSHIKGNSILKAYLGQHVFTYAGENTDEVSSCKDAESAACTYLLSEDLIQLLQTVSYAFFYSIAYTNA